jgi:hypothetical protein
MDRRGAAQALARRLECWGAERGWRGSDPYEGLNATRFVGALRRSALGRRLLIQAVKRSPVDLRRLLGIPPGANAVSVALAASAYAMNGFLEDGDARPRLRTTIDLLRRLRSDRYPELSWGYHFDFQSRVFFYARGEPNTIATAFAGMALLDAFEVLGDGRLLEEARDVGRFFMRRVPRTPAGSGAYFGYLPADRSPIHNANMLACALLARLAGRGDDCEGFRDGARAGLSWTLDHQRGDGSWPYGERPNLAWIDNFHTGYVLDAIRTCLDSGLSDPQVERAWQRGLAYFRRELLLPAGTPKYYSTGVYPIDAQCVAQSIQTLAIASRKVPAAGEDAWRVLDFALARMLRPDGLPIFQRGRLRLNRAPHMRWVVAPMLLAVAHLLRATDRVEGERPGNGHRAFRSADSGLDAALG